MRALTLRPLSGPGPSDPRRLCGSFPVRSASGIVLTLAVVAVAGAQTPTFDPHGDPEHGALRQTTFPSTRGQCSQCHLTHGDAAVQPNAEELFTDNTNQLCFSSAGDSPCHQAQPSNYPLDEIDRIPESEAEAGYFEVNAGGLRSPGVALRGRWPGEAVYSDPTVTPAGGFVSPHAHDPDMPRRDGFGAGLCLNCHNPHGTANPFDALIGSYRGLGGHDAVGPPEEYAHCLQCHGRNGPAGMDVENQYIEDYYDSGLNEHAGHRIAMNSAVALSWPQHVRQGDMLPCYDCHNPHGSQGYDRVRPNAYLLSDQRPGWSDLTDTRNDPDQNRRFCLGCHIPSDGVPGSQTVEGIVMNTIPEREAHRSTSLRGCFECHGRDYDGPTSNNVHNPGH